MVVMADGDYDHAEIEKLREWRHNVAMPAIASLRGRLTAAEGRLDKVEPRVERMAKADEIADAVTEHMRTARRGLLTKGEKLGGALVGISSVAAVVAQFWH